MIRIANWTTPDGRRSAESFCKRPAFDAAAEKTAARILADVRREGDDAVLRYARKLDGANLKAAGMRVEPEAFTRAAAAVDNDFKTAARDSLHRITAFSHKGMRPDWIMPSPRGGRLGEKFTPLDRVGVYIPAAEAPLASTALMTAAIARCAGVREIVACTAAIRGMDVNPYVLFALKLAGATEVYRVGGVQAIGMMAYGTDTVRPVQKIVGPGGAYVTAGKKLVYGTVALDLVAGPSEIAVLADAAANPRIAAADLLSQIEHGTGNEKALLVTTSASVAKRTATELERQSRSLSRSAAIRRNMRGGVLIVIVPDMETGVEICNTFAPEHLELLVRRPMAWLRRVRCAGAVFVGPWTPESAGDFAAGPSHVLPTGGTARMFSGLTVDDFRRRTSFMALTRADLEEMLPTIEAFGRVERLDGHAMSARLRFEEGAKE
ncbi:MAG: histidinol dehydrogenase [Lentisphaerae bacterium]|nr:histidinol dehydrogenase [Lentisphaerota bacterium]